MGNRLQGKVTIITGATSGIGEATARRFAAEGATVLMAGRNVERGEALARELGGQALFQAADVMREADIAALVDTAHSRFGRLDCMFNNAGGNRPACWRPSPNRSRYAMKCSTAARSSASSMRACHERQRCGGSIINNASIAAHARRKARCFTHVPRRR